MRNKTKKPTKWKRIAVYEDTYKVILREAKKKGISMGAYLRSKMKLK